MKKSKKVDAFKTLKKLVYNESFWKVRKIVRRGAVAVEVRIPIAVTILMSNFEDAESIKPIANYMKIQAIEAVISRLQELKDSIPNPVDCSDGKYDTPC